MHGYCLQLNNQIPLVISKVSTESDPLKEQVNESTVPKKGGSTTDHVNESMTPSHFAERRGQVAALPSKLRSHPGYVLCLPVPTKHGRLWSAEKIDINLSCGVHLQTGQLFLKFTVIHTTRKLSVSTCSDINVEINLSWGVEGFI